MRLFVWLTFNTSAVLSDPGYERPRLAFLPALVVGVAAEEVLLLLLLLLAADVELEFETDVELELETDVED
jgi:hypothetical protein